MLNSNRHGDCSQPFAITKDYTVVSTHVPEDEDVEDDNEEGGEELHQTLVHPRVHRPVLGAVHL